MRKTKIVCTIGPASTDEGIITQMCLAGMNVARLNFSHGSFEEHLERIELVKKVRKKLNLPIAILLDTKGPEYRIKTFQDGKVSLNAGDEFSFTTCDIKGDNKRVSVNYKGLINDLSVGDTITVGDDAGITVDLKISSIVENYVYNYVYLSRKMYEEKFGEDLKLNTALLKLTEDGKAHEDEVAKDWLKKNDILVVTSTSYVISSFEDIISSLNSVVVLMIICAAALAFVVLYNLTNINVAERMREIATIKVLGFTEKESANYVYRENIVLSVIGIAVGLVMGIFLSNYIVSTIEMDIVMFGRSIHGISFIYAAAFTLVFTLLVNVSMYGKLNNISMVESLKSVE